MSRLFQPIFNTLNIFKSMGSRKEPIKHYDTNYAYHNYITIVRLYISSLSIYVLQEVETEQLKRLLSIICDLQVAELKVSKIYIDGCLESKTNNKIVKKLRAQETRIINNTILVYKRHHSADFKQAKSNLYDRDTLLALVIVAKLLHLHSEMSEIHKIADYSDLEFASDFLLYLAEQYFYNSGSSVESKTLDSSPCSSPCSSSISPDSDYDSIFDSIFESRCETRFDNWIVSGSSYDC